MNRGTLRSGKTPLFVKGLAALGALFLGVTSYASGERAALVRETLGLSYPEGRTISVELEGTSRLPRASGEAKVERKKGMTEIEIELDEMKPATLFGGDYNTYVLWVASPEGHVDNTGELILEGNRSKLNVSTPLATFGMFVTAEPHFLVDSPSRFVVLENTEPKVDDAVVTISRIEYDGSQGIYAFENESLEDMEEAAGEVRSHVAAARTAVALAERDGADQYAAPELSRARESLKKTETAAELGVEGKDIVPHAHETIRLAVEAQAIARERAFQNALDVERQAHARRIGELRADADAAVDEAERARVVAERRALEKAMEARARKAAEAEARRARERAERAEDERRAAEHQRLDAERQRVRAEAERLRAERLEAEARRARERAREELADALGRVAAVRNAARGVIVEISDVLFEFDSATLTPHGREVLAKVAGVLLVADGYTLSVEGHTDNIGSDAYNRELSEKRAEAVRGYLVSHAIEPESVTATGLGETKPVASNDTEDGRRRNRRVELIVTEKPEPAARRVSSER